MVTFVSGAKGQRGIESTPPQLFSRHEMVRSLYRGRFTWQMGLIWKILTSRYDSVIFHGDVWSLSTWPAAAIARLRNRQVLFWTIGWHRPEKGLLRAFRMSFYRLANELLVYGNTAQEIGVQTGYPADRMTVIYNSHDSSQQITTTASKDLASKLVSNEPLVGCVIRLTAPKRLDLLLEAAAILMKTGSAVRVVIAGEGPEREHLQAQARALGVNCLFLGPVYAANDLQVIYEALDVTVVPAAAGLTVIQSLAHGVPVITDDDIFGQMPEAEAVVKGQTGSRYKHGDVEALAEAIRRWVSQTRAEREATARAARTEVEARWTPEAQAGKIAGQITKRSVHS